MKCLVVSLLIVGSVLGKPNRNVRNSDDNKMGQPQGTQGSQGSQGAQGFQQQCIEGNVFTQGHLKWKCQDGFPQPLACIGSERIKSQEIPINSTKTIDGYWYKCQIEGTSVKYQEEPRCNVSGKLYHVNETIKESNLVLECRSNAVIPTGCYFTDDKGKEITTKIGETLLIDGVQHKCGGFTGGSSSDNKIQTQNVGTGAPACLSDGKTYKPGEKWEGKTGFMYTCTDDALVNVSACIVSAGVTIPVGQSKVIDDYYHRCIRDDKGRFRYTGEPCKVAVICEGPNIGQPVNNAPATGQRTSGTGQQTSGSKTSIGSGNDDQGSVVSTVQDTDNVRTQVVSETSGGVAPKQCTKNGKAHQFNDEWSENGFKYICQPNGRVNVTACVADDGTEIPAGKTIVKGGLQHQCRYKPGGIIYEALVCGSMVDCGSNSTATGTSTNMKTSHPGQATEVASGSEGSSKKC